MHLTRDLVLTYIRGASCAGCLRTRNLRNRRRTRRIRRDRIRRSRIASVDPKVSTTPSCLWHGNIVRTCHKGEKSRLAFCENERRRCLVSFSRSHCKIINKLTSTLDLSFKNINKFNLHPRIFVS